MVLFLKISKNKFKHEIVIGNHKLLGENVILLKVILYLSIFN